MLAAFAVRVRAASPATRPPRAVAVRADLPSKRRTSQAGLESEATLCDPDKAIPIPSLIGDNDCRLAVDLD